MDFFLTSACVIDLNEEQPAYGWNVKNTTLVGGGANNHNILFDTSDRSGPRFHEL